MKTGHLELGATATLLSWQRLRVAILTDLHMCEPYLTLGRLARVVARTNALKPDLTVVLGDLPANSRFITRAIPPE